MHCQHMLRNSASVGARYFAFSSGVFLYAAQLKACGTCQSGLQPSVPFCVDRVQTDAVSAGLAEIG